MTIPPIGTVNLFDWLNNNELARRRACRTGKRIIGGVVCGESEDRRAARMVGNSDEAKCRRGENNG